MIEKLAQACEGGRVHSAHPPPVTISTITYKVVVVHVPAEREDALPLFVLLYPYVLCVLSHY